MNSKQNIIWEHEETIWSIMTCVSPCCCIILLYSRIVSSSCFTTIWGVYIVNAHTRGRRWEKLELRNVIGMCMSTTRCTRNCNLPPLTPVVSAVPADPIIIVRGLRVGLARRHMFPHRHHSPIFYTQRNRNHPVSSNGYGQPPPLRGSNEGLGGWPACTCYSSNTHQKHLERNQQHYHIS